MTAEKVSCLEEKVGCCRRADLLIGTVLIASVAVTVVVVMLVSPWNGYGSTTAKPTVAPATNKSTSSCVDVAVIGGGAGGAYFAWKMRNRSMSINVFEYSDRVGGRLLSAQFPPATGTYLELGGMRFKRTAHPVFAKTVADLGLNIVPFELGFGNAEETVWYVRGKHLRNTDLGTDTVPYDVAPGEPKDPDSLIWNIVSKSLNLSSNTFPSLEEMYQLHTTGGTPVYKMSIDRFYGKYASPEAYKLIYDTGGWEDIIGPIGGLHVPKAFTVFPGDTGSSEGYKTVEGGMDQVPKKLMEEFLAASKKHKFHRNLQLMKIDNRRDGNYNLFFRQTRTEDGITTPLKASLMPSMCAKKVVLAVAKPCVQDIEFDPFTSNPEVIKLIDSVIDYTAGKIFLAYESKWWKTNSPDITHSKSDLRTRQTYDWRTGSNNVSIILASYHDGPLTRFWRELSKVGEPIPGSLKGANAVTEVVKDQLEQYLSEIYNFSRADIPEAVGGAMMLWDQYPFEGAWSYFRPGADERVVLPKIKKPLPSEDVFIVGNSWAPGDLSGWVEGSLIAVDEVIQKNF